ncbi:DNA alkylation repair protein [Bacteroides propionicifaciens]|uniref:DNA alkylation repair protein n=1 Tax=Bacteroides propionicifaciens TaxID=392838 RepID=UPI000381E372|nr:DNA alkylation repair protein [Bacteroides propionicifaciens]
MTVQEQIKDIRSQLRLYMNGVVSASMRKSGLDYKLNFGVELPRIKEIAATCEPSVALAESLWVEQTRELRILATLLYPREEFTVETANHWLKEVGNIEIANLLVMNQLQHIEGVCPLSFQWIADKDELIQTIGYATISRLLNRGVEMDERAASEFVNQAVVAAVSGEFNLRNASIMALKNFMKQSPNNKYTILAAVEPYADSSDELAKVLYDIIHNEASYL